MIILGIDPGTARMGYGLVRKEKGLVESIDYGVLETSKGLSAGERLLALETGLERLIQLHKPEVAAIESLYFFRNLTTAMPVSEARGVALLILSRKGISAVELAPTQVKTAIAGYGKASKLQVQRMVKEILRLKELPKPDDAADALALAIACSVSLKG